MKTGITTSIDFQKLLAQVNNLRQAMHLLTDEVEEHRARLAAVEDLQKRYVIADTGGSNLTQGSDKH